MIEKLANYSVALNNLEEYRVIKKEIWTQDIYSLNNFPFINLKNEPLIIDIGAHIGLSVLYFARHCLTCKIYAVEPLESNFKLLILNIENNLLQDKVFIENIAISGSNSQNEETRDFYFHNEMMVENSWLSTGSFFPNAWNGAQVSSKTLVKSIGVDLLIQRALGKFKKKHIELMKIDIEGAELQVLKKSTFDSKIVKNIVLEVHPIDKNFVEKIKKIIRQKGYEITIKDHDGMYIFYCFAK